MAHAKWQTRQPENLSGLNGNERRSQDTPGLEELTGLNREPDLHRLGFSADSPGMTTPRSRKGRGFMVGVDSRGGGGVRWRAGMDVPETGCGGSGVRSGYDPLPSLSPGPGSARAHNTQPQLEPAHASLGERKRLGGTNVHFCENLAGKRKTGLKGTEYSGSNTASKWGRSCPGTVPGLARTASWNKCLEPAPENCTYQSCFTIGGK